MSADFGRPGLRPSPTTERRRVLSRRVQLFVVITITYNVIEAVIALTEGTLVVDLVDRVRNEVVWSGTAVGQLTKKVLDNPGPHIDQSVADIFARYPIKPH